MKRNIVFVLYAFTGVISVITIPSCSKEQDVNKGIYFQDFDNLKMWDHNTQVTDKEAHSGRYCTYTDSSHQFSQTFEMNAADAVEKGYKSAQITAWCRKPSNESRVQLVASIEVPNSPAVARDGVNFDTHLEIANTWIDVVLFLKIPDHVPQGAKLKVYCFSPGKEESFMDDVRIEFRKN